MQYICRKCELPIDDVAEAMIEGCECGSKVFGQIKSNKSVDNSEEETKTDLPNQKSENDVLEEIAIMVKDKGKYQVNIKNLIERSSDSDPIFIQDKNGVINVLFNPDA